MCGSWSLKAEQVKYAIHNKIPTNPFLLGWLEHNPDSRSFQDYEVGIGFKPPLLGRRQLKRYDPVRRTRRRWGADVHFSLWLLEVIVVRNIENGQSGRASSDPVSWILYGLSTVPIYQISIGHFLSISRWGPCRIADRPIVASPSGLGIVNQPNHWYGTWASHSKSPSQDMCIQSCRATPVTDHIRKHLSYFILFFMFMYICFLLLLLA